MISFFTKRTILTFLFSGLFCWTLMAQISIELYGVASGSPMTNTPFDVVSIDPLTAAVTPLFSSGTGTAVAAGASTFDHDNKRHISWGIDVNGAKRIYTADIDSGMVISQPLATVNPIEMEYDLQNQKTYGLWYDQSTSTEYFVDVDLATGTATNINSIPYNAVAIGNSTFDSNQGHYFCMVTGNGPTNLELISIDAATGNVLTNIPINQGDVRLGGLEFDVNSNKLHCLVTETDSTIYNAMWGTYGYKMSFGEVNWTTGQVTKIGQPFINSEFAGYSIGGIAFDQESQIYIAYLSGNNGFELTLIDASSGTVLSQAPITQNFSELQCDNDFFAQYFYNVSSTNPIKNQSIQVRAFPNPATDYLNIEANKMIQDILITNVKGEIVRQLTVEPNTAHQVNVKELATGMYFLTVQTEVGKKTLRFVK